MTKEALVCWVGGRDLDASRGISDKPGPILSTLKERPHAKVHLLYNYDRDEVHAYGDWLGAQVNVEIHLHEADLSTPVHYGDIYQAASKLMKALSAEISFEDMSVLISPGTPQMQTIWILMCKTAFPAAMLEASEEQGITDFIMPFDIAADYIPNIRAESDANLRRMAAGQAATPPAFESIIRQSPLMNAQIMKAEKIAKRDIPVLILGESGTGKEMFAEAIHESSSRADSEFVVVNCGAIPQDLADSELFGHKKGAFTGAVADRVGRFQEADGGTIFLDEFGELPADTQVRLLRVLNDGTFTRVGDKGRIKVDVRVIAATNRDLMAEVVEGQFREDLFYRIAVGIINLPSLREREGDLMLLTDKFLKDINEAELDLDSGYKHKKLSAKAINVMKSHGWPGNVRELQASLTRAAVWSVGETITEREMREALLERPAKAGDLLGRSLDNSFDIQDVIKELKRHYIKKALAETGNNKTKSAEKLGLNNYQTLNKWIEDVGLKE
ncbi:sigma-54-dependent Fis family transcriptional regulator [Parahaliea maris]|uniref:Sigma-54-dependent Fis family transcriptional regulator n=1 Tax=Parahaliea maris TaxID=2716870 RepID=A0A5C8ZYF5_9GAMM|nr:sigma-54 dependent transcriptional regulator [Parahaliea maris]TXS92754.1 sigma-54-dependent Fis family transcriptional regulator [Parahaliea maris]